MPKNLTKLRLWQALVSGVNPLRAVIAHPLWPPSPDPCGQIEEQVGNRQGVFATGNDQGSARPPVLGESSCFLTFRMT